MRKTRRIVQGASYHVTARANRQEFILNPPEIKDLFLEVIGRAKYKYKFKLTNFCIMGNHIHLMIKPDDQENLSRIMQWILATFAINFNKRFNFIGHVWYDRFHSTVIESFRQYLKTFEYIKENPVKAELVQNADKYKYGGLWFLQKGLYELLEPPNPFLHMMFPEVSLRAL